MYKNKKILAVITARGGSKGILGKNIKPLSGKPLIYWTLSEARKSKYIDKIIVSTDDPGIADISRKHGAEVPFLRPKKLAQDKSSSMDVLFHAIDWLKQRGLVFDIVVLLQPTSPLRTKTDIDEALMALFKRNAMAIVSVAEAFYPPLWTNTLPSDGNMKNFLPKGFVNKNRQSLPKYYQFNGAIYLGLIEYIKKKRSFLGESTYAYLMPKERSVDIDDTIDFLMAEILLKKQKDIRK
ncbi:MAG: acylneuraminate cytidylyltransferase family protein [Candidatus Omnitrophica bacterium]|nr:acylneuraminate cytidylyltransferase family protein [Candidatus Omnitrophota bacterium]